VLHVVIAVVALYLGFGMKPAATQRHSGDSARAIRG
jgi:hypothetical protein